MATGIRKTTTRTTTAKTPAPERTREELEEAFEEVSTRSRKRSEESAPVRVVEEERKRQETVVKSALDGTIEDVVRQMTDLKLSSARAVDAVAGELVAARERLADVHEAVEIETTRLKNLYDITVVADTLALLLSEHERKRTEFDDELPRRRAEAQAEADAQRQTFEREMAEKRETWKREQQLHDQQLKERDSSLKRERERDEEEYTYQLKRKRQLDEDAYKQQQQKLQRDLAATRESQEKELAERERLVSEREEELKRLQTEVAAFPARLETAVRQADKEATQRAEARAKAEATLAAKDSEAASVLAKLRIETLERTIGEKETRLAALQAQLDGASSKVSEIAIRAIEGASGTKALQTVNEIALEQAKNVGK